MIKRTIYVGSQAYLSTKDEQLIITSKEEEPEQVPIEDIGVLMLDHPQVTITQSAIAKLVANNTAVITCDGTHHPTRLVMPLDGSTVQGERYI
jgi:CRISPR-associated protein Cas1